MMRTVQRLNATAVTGSKTLIFQSGNIAIHCASTLENNKKEKGKKKKKKKFTWRVKQTDKKDID